MAKAKQKGVPSGEISFNMTPMIDCTFQLIIFFILASQAANQAIAQNVKVPRPDSSQAVPQKDMEVLNKLIINVPSSDPEGKNPDRLAAGAAKCYQVYTRKIDVGDLESLVDVIREKKAEAVRAKAVSEDDESRQFFIEVRADRHVNWQDVAPVVKAGAIAGVRKMTITALTAQE